MFSFFIYVYVVREDVCMQPIYKRIILKISGEALSAGAGEIFDHDLIENVSRQIITASEMGVQIGLVVGGGNIWRGRAGKMANMDAVTADHMGMLGTAINALALQDGLERKGLPSRVMTAVEMRQFAEPYVRRRALRHLEKGRVVIFACGIGNPHFTTDTAAALRAVEMDADVILLAKNIDAVYDSDPRTNPDAKRLSEISCREAIQRNLKVMDITAFTMCMDNNMPIEVFALNAENSVIKVLSGERIGTLVHP